MMAEPASPERYTQARPCPICGGWASLPRGQGRRCDGYLFGKGAYCARAESPKRHRSADLYFHRLAAERFAPTRSKRIVAEYDYTDEQGTLLFQAVRFDPKDFAQRRRKQGGGWDWSVRGVRLVPYRLPELVTAVARGQIVYVVEGEKDVDRLREAGVVATCNPMGAGKWRPEYAEHFRGATDVRIVADNDEPGHRHAAQVARSIRGAAAAVAIFRPAVGKDVSDHLDAGRTLEQLVEFEPEGIGEELPSSEGEKPGSAANEADGSLYAIEDGCIVQRRRGREGNVFSAPLANFSARIVAEEVRDDGVEQSCVYRIEGKLANGRTLPPATVVASSFASMGWIAGSWGAAAVPTAGNGARDHLRAAIQTLSGEVPRETVYTQTGWRIVEGESVYLHAGGAIGAAGVVPGIAVSPPDTLSRFVLPAPPEGDALRAAIEASLGLLDVAPHELTIPILAAVYRAPIGGCDFALHLEGPTGSFKTSLAALAAQHYGSTVDDRNLPASWSSTANSLEGLAFAAADVLLVVDDFAPHGTASEVQRFHRDADRLFRAQGNHSGRARMRQDGTLRPTKPPRGLILSTGEDLPAGHSVRARLIILSVREGAVRCDRLTEAQRLGAGGLFAASMAGFVRWLAPRLSEVRASVHAAVEEWRESSFAHRRTSDAVGSLLGGLRAFLAFAEHAGALSRAEAQALEKDAVTALRQSGLAQGEHQRAEDPVLRTLELLVGALEAGEAHIASADDEGTPPLGLFDVPVQRLGWREHRAGDGTNGEEPRSSWEPKGSRIGWARGDDLFLEPESAFRVLQRFAVGQGEGIGFRQGTLWRRMNERELLASHDARRATTKVSIGTSRPRVVHFHLSTVFGRTAPAPTAPLERGSDSQRGTEDLL